MELCRKIRVENVNYSHQDQDYQDFSNSQYTRAEIENYYHQFRDLSNFLKFSQIK